MYNFFEIQRQVLIITGRTVADAGSDELQRVKDVINNVIQSICNFEQFYFMRRDTDFITVAEDTSGTVDVTNGSSTVTGTSTAFTGTEDRKFRVDGDDIVYEVSSVASATSLTLDRNYEGTTATGSDYKIFQDRYSLPIDFDQISTLRERSGNRFLTELTPIEFDEILPDPDSLGTPDSFFIHGLKRFTYSTGTVATTNDSATVTGTSTVWTTADHEGRIITVGDDDISYIVESVDSATQITLNRDYEGVTASGTAYTLIGEFNQIYFNPIPNAVLEYEIRYFKTPLVLGDNQDLSDLPSKYQKNIINGAASVYLTARGETSRADRYKRMFDEGMAKMIQDNEVSVSRIDQRKKFGIQTAGRIPSRVLFPVIPTS